MTHAPALTTTGAPVVVGELFAGKYVIEREIGAGGMGVVMAARHQQLGQTVAIKLLAVPPETHPEAVRRFLAEAQAAARLRSEHVARVMDADIDDKGRHYIIMEYLQGSDLGGVLRDTGPLSVTDAVGYLLQACEGIAEAHANGIVHRDIKPENLFVTRRIDGSPLVKVLDFGISKMISSDLRPQLSVTPRGALMGSPLYMSPEQLRAPTQIDARSDIWGLGVILYELLTNSIPFGGAELPEVIAAVLTGAPAPVQTLRPDVPAELAGVIAKALEKDVNRRYANVGELARALLPWAPGWASDAAVRAMRTLGLATGGEISGVMLAAGATPVLAPAVVVATASPGQPRGAVIAVALVAGVAGLVALGVTSGAGDAPVPQAAAPAAVSAPRKPAPALEAEPAPQAAPTNVAIVPVDPAPTAVRPAVLRRPERRSIAPAGKPKPKRARTALVDPLEGRK